ncbi:MAG: hypothetical protein H3C30_18895 [Candidatus Hydrogenedentes bacterium]|nr:hypothetical protein [Candidatus Hydrogenedentota bacterium]
MKHEDVYLPDYEHGHAPHRRLSRYFRFYNHERSHNSLGNGTPANCHNRRD